MPELREVFPQADDAAARRDAVGLPGKRAQHAFGVCLVDGLPEHVPLVVPDDGVGGDEQAVGVAHPLGARELEGRGGLLLG